MEQLSIEQTAAAYLEAEAEAKAATKLAKGLKDQLDAQLSHEDVVDVNGLTYLWTVKEGRAPKYKELVGWLKSICTPDVVVLIEEGTETFTGVRVTKSLQQV